MTQSKIVDKAGAGALRREVVGLEVVVGVDCHKGSHHAAVVTAVGEVVGDRRFPATAAGGAALLGWAAGFGRVVRVGIEGTGSYGARLTAELSRAGVEVVEAGTVVASTRRLRGKSDPLDAVAAARLVWSGQAVTVPKSRDGVSEQIRPLHNARRLLVAQQTQWMNQIHDLLMKAPEMVGDQLAQMLPQGRTPGGGWRTGIGLVRACARLDPSTAGTDGVVAAVITTLVLAAGHWLGLHADAAQLSAKITDLVEQANPTLLDQPGIGPDSAAQLLLTVGDNPDRIRSAAAFAMLTGAAPIPASSGQTNRHRLSRGGDRQANAALHRIIIVRLRHHPETQAFIATQLARGKTKRDAIRSAKRYLARRLYPLLITPATT